MEAREIFFLMDGHGKGTGSLLLINVYTNNPLFFSTCIVCWCFDTWMGRRTKHFSGLTPSNTLVSFLVVYLLLYAKRKEARGKVRVL